MTAPPSTRSSARFSDAPPATAPPTLVWLDALKGVAMLWIVLNHVVEKMAGGEYLGNPTADWPPLAVRIAQFATPAGAGLGGLALTLVRDAGWLGDQGVTLFLIASGFGLGLGLVRRNAARLDAGAFFRARAARIYPLWLGAHAALLVWLFATWAKIGPAFVLSALGVRFLPQTVYAFVPAWWYVGLLLQLYAVVPLLWPAVRRYGAGRTLAVVGVVAFAVRGAGLFALQGHAYVDAWSRGAIFVTRLPEFAFGLCFAAWYAADPDGVLRRMRGVGVRLAALGAAVAGLLAAFTLAGMTVAPFLMGVGVFVLAVPRLARGRSAGVTAWTGRRSYPIYLVHQPFIDALVPAGGTVSALAAGLRIALALGLSLGAARTLETAVALKVRYLTALVRRGPVRAAVALALWFAAIYGTLVALDVAAARFAPLEIDGWGERPSLVPDDVVGWKLVPSRITHLRWTSYDYVVRSNALGFPGGDVPEAKPPGTLRVFVTGDAFTSGEGVGTDEAWPALLGPLLARREHRDVQVLNFAVTGYGPDQEARVVRAYVPRLRPDVVVFESFVNAFEKLGQDDDAIRASIGFGKPAPGGLRTTLRLLDLRAFLSEDVIDVLRERWTGRTDPEDAGFADGSAFLRDDPDFPREAVAYVARVRAARDVARRIHARFLLAMIPSRAQACSARDFPRGAFLDLDAPAYDAGRPQRTAAAAAARLGVPFLDLRDALRAGGACRFQPANMHVLAAGDRAIARAVAERVAALRAH